ncbi:23S ribosomal RNA methyltransferase Erm [Compostimonas suwonensis]|uniref:23S rRNA (Adenine-N6)-dimethyltransferase n=1 Tax=Compostimonas suwonensis TaxID=1048394 RepID=A0A2M9BZN2_9MICO|nr:23S ribosomal RNA methyltransferase Erm [Compostimonas suwonensis]PJJ63533.1 23S rRNA (adenine-N6)-dimethyltransferase [Compostimonas suwonensis]
MPHTNRGRHEHGQNFLVDHRIIRRITSLVDDVPGPIVELGAGDGALTLPLVDSGRSVVAVEIDVSRAQRLESRLRQRVVGQPSRARQSSSAVRVVVHDMLDYRFTDPETVVVSNVPFHLTTALLRKLLADRGWRHAVLLTQWEVARRRAGVGGASLMTALWWPWFEFTVHERVPARSFRPVPSVDGGLFTIVRRAHPLVDDRRDYQSFVKRVFTGPGRGLRGAARTAGRTSSAQLARWARDNGLPSNALPRDLNAEQWAGLWRLCRADGPRPR